MRRPGNMAALEAAHERLARAKAEHARERMVREKPDKTRFRNPGVPSKAPPPFPGWLVLALAILAYLVAWGLWS